MVPVVLTWPCLPPSTPRSPEQRAVMLVCQRVASDFTNRRASRDVSTLLTDFQLLAAREHGQTAILSVDFRRLDHTHCPPY